MTVRSASTSVDDRSRACGRILIVDDHREARRSMAEVLRHAGHSVECRSSAVEALRALDDEAYDVIITDLKMPGMTGLELIAKLRARPHGAQILMVTAHATVATAVEAMRSGAFDYIEKPFDAEQLEQLVLRAIDHGRMLDGRSALGGSESGDSGAATPTMIGESQPMQLLRQRIAQVAPTPETVLITGESGTGKELIARSIHASSDRSGQPLVSLNCPVLSAHLMESELFGHVPGAFTGADTARTGRFELADRGTILLDEVTEIDLSLQAKLLRVLQERAFEKVGSSTTIGVDVRVLATTNRDLLVAVEAQQFRSDLYYRLAVVPIHVPALRDRREDVPLLVDHFLMSLSARIRSDPPEIDDGARQLLTEHHWPGNIRELENIVRRACVVQQHGPVRADDLRPWLIGAGQREPNSTGETIPVGLSLHEMERKMIEATLEKFDGHRGKTAAALGIGIRTLSGKLRAFGYAPRAKSARRAA